MKGFGILLLVSMALIAVAICGPPPVQAGTHFQEMNIASHQELVTFENPASLPGVVQVIHDPDPAVAGLEAAAVNRSELTACRPFRRFGNGVQRLLNFRLCG